jgi:hypothetical protein
MAAQKKYPDELRERAVRMLFEVRERERKGHGVVRPGESGGCSVCELLLSSAGVTFRAVPPSGVGA